MYERVIFLDVDGVLNDSLTPDRAPGGFIGISSQKVSYLKQIVDYTHADIVLTSSWKSEWSSKPDECTDDGLYLTERLKEQGLTIADKTMDRSYDRGRGIVNWLESHPGVKHWVVLDDDRFADYDEYGIIPHWVRSSWRHPGGLNPRLVPKAIHILTGGVGDGETESSGDWK